MKIEEKLGMIFDSLSKELSITQTMLDKAVTSYTALGNHIKYSNEEWDVSVYPQGSFELGTVIKPLNADEQYDVDLVVLVKRPEFSPQELRENIRGLLESHGRYEGKIQEKKPCIRIQYADSSQFHMDIASAKNGGGNQNDEIQISRIDEDLMYYYDPSNPKGYVEWFKKVMNYEKILLEKRALLAEAETDIEKIELTQIHSSLQKSIQILKRHRDIYFAKKANSEDKPSSVVITTLCGLSYESEMSYKSNKDNVYITIKNMLNNFDNVIKHSFEDGWILNNPSMSDENFLKKWKDNRDLKSAYDNWLRQAKLDILTNPEKFIETDQNELRAGIFESFGESVGKDAFMRYGEEMGELAKTGALKFNAANASITTSDGDRSYNKHTYFGE